MAFARVSMIRPLQNGHVSGRATFSANRESGMVSVPFSGRGDSEWIRGMTYAGGFLTRWLFKSGQPASLRRPRRNGINSYPWLTTVQVLGMIIVPMLAVAISGSRAEDVTGIWDVAAKFSITGGPADGRSTDMKAVLELTQQGNVLTGRFTPYEADGKTAQPALPIANGHIDGTTLTFTVNNDADSSLKFALVLANGHLQGEATPNKDVAGGKLTIKVDATRRK